MNDDEHSEFLIEDPTLVVQAMLPWANEHYLRFGVTEMVDYFRREILRMEADEDAPGPEMVEAMDILFRGTMMGQCSHPPETVEHPPITEDDISEFQKLLGLNNDDEEEN